MSMETWPWSASAVLLLWIAASSLASLGTPRNDGNGTNAKTAAMRARNNKPLNFILGLESSLIFLFLIFLLTPCDLCHFLIVFLFFAQFLCYYMFHNILKLMVFYKKWLLLFHRNALYILTSDLLKN